MRFTGENVLSGEQLSKEDVVKVIEIAEKFLPYARKEKSSNMLAGRVLAALFYEPSTRTRLSFETAMNRLGGRVISVVGMENSSLKKGETLYDTACVISQFADVVAMRHADLGSVKDFSRGASVPVLNAGDGSGEHPTQALLDIFTLWLEKPGLNGLRIAMVGDLKFGRTVHSLVWLLRHFQVEIVFVSPDELKMPEEHVKMLVDAGIPVSFENNLEAVLENVDAVYMTRVQQERFSNQLEYERLKHAFVLTRSMLDSLKNKVFVMHPLPRVGEISPDVDSYECARYFQQVRNGVAVRMALLSLVLGVENKD